jgi:hypothetical protein
MLGIEMQAQKVKGLDEVWLTGNLE